MTKQPATLGGSPAVTIDQAHYTQWPIYTEEEAQAAADLIRNHALSSAQDGPGPITELETLVADTWGVQHAIAHSSGTTALRTALFGVGVVPGDEVITQSAVHPFNCLPIIGCGAVPVFADIDPLTTTLEPADVERKITPRTRAIMVVHWKGIPADMDAIMDIARRHGLKVVEDNAVSQGTTHRGRMLGTIGDASAISFQDGKLTSAGEGGVFMTDSDEVFQRAATLGHYERLKNLPDPKWRAVSGFSFGEKYRMATITAAIGVVQMKHWRERLDVRHDNAAKLGRVIAEIDGFFVPDYPDYFPSPYLAGRILFHPDRLDGISRDRLIEALNAEGANVKSPARRDSRIPHTDGLWRMLHKHPVFAGNEHGTEDILWEVLGPNATKIDYKSVVLPVTEDSEVPYDTIELPSFTRPADDLIDQYAKAFDKVAANAGRLAEAGA